MSEDSNTQQSVSNVAASQPNTPNSQDNGGDRSRDVAPSQAGSVDQKQLSVLQQQLGNVLAQYGDVSLQLRNLGKREAELSAGIDLLATQIKAAKGEK